MFKKVMTIIVLLFLSFMIIGCSGDVDVTPDDQNDQQDHEQQDDSNTNGENGGTDENSDENDDTDTDDETYDPVDNGFLVAGGTLESRETNQHLITIEQTGVYEIYTISSFDTVGVINTLEDERIKRNGRIDDFHITIFLEPNTYIVEVSGFSRDEFGGYGLYVQQRKDLVGIHYYALDSVAAYDVNEHSFTVTTAGTYSIYGESSFNTQGTLYNSTGNYLTTDYDSHEGLGFFIEFYLEPGTYEIHVRGYDWSAGDYEILIYKD